MALSPGTRLGHYNVTALLGEGGMGQVWQATDTQLNRQVALKILPDAFAADPDRLARFKREAQILASLNHPNIAAIYGIEESEGTRALVLELVEGPTLADRISKGPIPLDEALPIAKQIAEALEAAHEAGVIHRDLKPANIKVKDDGTVKVLDFGLAKAFQPDPGDPSLSQSPTISLTAAATQMGMVLGTAAYMAPEQAKGRPVRKQADVWAFGAVLFEMLAGRKAFSGEDMTDTVAAVVQGDPDWDLLPSDVPARIRQVVRACLQKRLADRPRDIGDVRLAMQGTFDTGGPEPVSADGRRTWRESLPLALGTLVAGAVLAGVAVWGLTQSEPPSPRFPTRFAVTAPPDVAMIPAFGLAVSPDGRTVVYVGTWRGENRLYRRSLGEVTSVEIPGVSAPWIPFFSPDGEWVGYFDQGDNTLKRVRLDGSSNPVTVGPGPGGWRSANWGVDDTIVFGSRQDGIWRISANGGEPELVRPGESNTEDTPRWLEVLPDGQAVLGTVGRTPDTEIVVVDLATGEPTTLLSGASPRYVSTGHLVYWREESLWAAPFDSDRRELTGPPVPVVPDVNMNEIANGLALFAVGGDSLVYLPTQGANARRLVWVDRDGNQEDASDETGVYFNPALSPNGQAVAVLNLDDVAIVDLVRGGSTRFTFDPGPNGSPLWSIDGARVVFTSYRDGQRSHVFAKAADGTGDVEQLTNGQIEYAATDWSPDGGVLVLGARHPETGSDVMALSMEGERTVAPLVQTEFNEINAKVSPDGRWLAYASDESGQFEVYVRPFPNTDAGKWAVSAGGEGDHPVWSHDGGELFYMAPDGMMAVPISSGPTWNAGRAVRLFGLENFDTVGRPGVIAKPYDVAPDGRFLMIQSTPGDSSLVVVDDWLSELQQLVPTN